MYDSRFDSGNENGLHTRVTLQVFCPYVARRKEEHIVTWRGLLDLDYRQRDLESCSIKYRNNGWALEKLNA